MTLDHSICHSPILENYLLNVFRFSQITPDATISVDD